MSQKNKNKKVRNPVWVDALRHDQLRSRVKNTKQKGSRNQIKKKAINENY